MACLFFNVSKAIENRSKYQNELSNCEQILDLLTSIQGLPEECSSDLYYCSDAVNNILLSDIQYDKEGKISIASTYIGAWGSKITDAISAVNKRIAYLEEEINSLNNKISDCGGN